LKKRCSLQNKLIFTPDNSGKTENKFGRNIQALTFALPLKNGTATTETNETEVVTLSKAKGKRSLKVGKQ
jgi:hypothetical protein